MEEQLEYDEVNLLDYARVVWKRKWLIIALVVIIVAATVALALMMKPIYESKAVIMPVTQANDPTGGMGAVAAQFGIAVPSQSGLSEIVNLLKSNVLREKLIARYSLLPILLSREASQGLSASERVWAGIRRLQASLKISVRQKDNAVEVSMQHESPERAASIVEYALAELTDYMSSEAKRVADTNRRYLETQLDKTADPYIKTKLYTLVAQQIEKSMMAEVKENFAFKVLDPPKVPDRKVKPKRAQMVIIAFVVSLFLGVFLAFGVEYVQKARNGNSRT